MHHRHMSPVLNKVMLFQHPSVLKELPPMRENHHTIPHTTTNPNTNLLICEIPSCRRPRFHWINLLQFSTILEHKQFGPYLNFLAPYLPRAPYAWTNPSPTSPIRPTQSHIWNPHLSLSNEIFPMQHAPPTLSSHNTAKPNTFLLLHSPQHVEILPYTLVHAKNLKLKWT